MCGSIQRYLELLDSAMTTEDPDRWGWRFHAPGTAFSVVMRIDETVFTNPMPNGLPVYHFQLEDGEPRQAPQHTLEGIDVAG